MAKTYAGEIAASGAGVAEEEQIHTQNYNVAHFIDESIIAILKGNNIFESVLSVEDVRNKLINIVTNIEFEDLTEKGLDGYWTTAGNKIVIAKNHEKKLFNSQNAKETLVHELLHALTTIEQLYNHENQIYESYCGINRSYYIQEKNRFEEYGRGLNEGITEYLAQKLCLTDGYRYSSGKISFDVSGSYPMEQIMISQLAILYGEDKIIEAYLNNHDIDMPHEEYLEIREYFDFINDTDSHIRNVVKGRSYKDLSQEELEDVTLSRSKIENKFIDSQQFFLENCLINEINNINTLEQAEEIKIKLQRLNKLNITIEGNENANYDKYNFAFIRKYLQIANRDKSYDEQVKFEDVEKYIVGDLSGLVTLNNKLLKTADTLNNSDKLLKKIGGFFVEGFQEIIADIKNSKKLSPIIEKIAVTLNQSKKSHESLSYSKQSKFTEIDRESEGKIYIKECGKEIIAGEEIIAYQYLTEEEFLRYQAGDRDVKGEILKGNIDIKRLKKDEEYKKAVGERLLAQDRIEDKLLNYNGYIGYIDENLYKHVNPEVQMRFEEQEKYIKLDLDGFDETMYITEMQNKEAEVSEYILLSKSELKERRIDSHYMPMNLLHGEIDLAKLNKDDRYREFVQSKFLNKERLDKCSMLYDSYVGEITDKWLNFSAKMEHVEEFAIWGANGEEKIESKIKIDNKEKKVNWYLEKGDKTGEKDEFGNELYTYEYISSDEMKKMWADKGYKDSEDREKHILIGSESDIKYLSYEQANSRLVYEGGYIGIDMGLRVEKGNKQCLEVKDAVIWENNGVIYVSKANGKELETKTKIMCNLDLERIGNDPEYEKFVFDNVLTLENINDIFAGNRNNIEISEKDGEFSYIINKKEQEEKEKTYHNKGIDR